MHAFNPPPKKKQSACICTIFHGRCSRFLCGRSTHLCTRKLTQGLTAARSLTKACSCPCLLYMASIETNYLLAVVVWQPLVEAVQEHYCGQRSDEMYMLYTRCTRYSTCCYSIFQADEMYMLYEMYTVQYMLLLDLSSVKNLWQECKNKCRFILISKSVTWNSPHRDRDRDRDRDHDCENQRSSLDSGKCWSKNCNNVPMCCGKRVPCVLCVGIYFP